MNSIVSLETFFSLSALIGIFALGIWWFIRRRRKELRMPILRILDFPDTRLPRVVVRVPPLLSFLCFLLVLLAFVVWAAEPRFAKFASHEPKQLKVHVFVDLSPSVSSYGSATQLASKIAELWKVLSPSSRLTMSTSHGEEIYESAQENSWQEIVQSLGFHRAGISLGTALRKHLSLVGDINKLVIVSDRDQHSWSSFAWQSLVDDMEIHWVDVGAGSIEAGARSNVFIQGVRPLPQVVPGVHEWRVDIGRSGYFKNIEGSLKASIRGETLATTSWKFSEESGRQFHVELSWPDAKIPRDDKELVISWELSTGADDAIEMDNLFRTTVEGRGGSVAIIAEPSGEHHTDDPGELLHTAFRVLGRDVDRYDIAPKQTERQERKSGVGPLQNNRYDLIVMLGGLGHGLKNFCSLDKGNNRWVMPWQAQVSYFELCECVALLTGLSEVGCNSGMQIRDYSEWLASQQGRQVGGSIGQSQEGLGYLVGPKSKEVLALTVPLMPVPTGGVSHSNFLFIVKSLMQLKNGRAPVSFESAQQDWPRISDLASLETTEDNQGKVFERSSQLSNVPVAESLMEQLTQQDLPPVWSGTISEMLSKGPRKLDSEDPLPWIRFLAISAVLFCGLEVVMRFLRRRRRLSLKAAAILGVLTAGIISSRSDAATKMVLYRPVQGHKVRFERLSRDVGLRTTIGFANEARVYENLTQELLMEPWIWTKTLDGLTDKDGQMKDSLVFWIKRGGLLILEQTGLDEASLERFMSPLMTGTNRAKGWASIPQDHELMRSFYLLETLPSCNAQMWKWFDMDRRLAILSIPYSLSQVVSDAATKPSCEGGFPVEYQSRLVVNLLMLALTTDYKRDQIHLPEILKRLKSP